MDALPPPASPSVPDTRPVALEAVSVPSILLMVTGAVGFGLLGLELLSRLLGGGRTFPPELIQNPNFAQYRETFEHMSTLGQRYGWVSSVGVLGVSALVIYGAVQMRTLKSYSWAMAGSILAMIPCIGPCCCLGLPIGIWSVVVLSRPEVKAAFEK